MHVRRRFAGSWPSLKSCCCVFIRLDSDVEVLSSSIVYAQEKLRLLHSSSSLDSGWSRVEIDMDHSVRHIFDGRNQFAFGGLLLMAIGSLGALLHSLPERAWNWIVNQSTMTITVKDDDAAFAWVKEWLLEQSFLKRIRRVDLDTTLRGAELALMPAPGVHFFWHVGRPFWVTFSRSEDTKGRSQRRIESLSFRTSGRDQIYLKRFVDEVVACHHRRSRMMSCLYVYDDYWSTVEAYSPRLLASVILKPGEKEHLLEDLERFRASRERYQQLGVPYHRGYLLHGAAGNRQDVAGLGSGVALRHVYLRGEPIRVERQNSQGRDERSAAELRGSLRGYRRDASRQPQT